MSRKRRKPAPLDRQAMEELALTYLARFSTSSARLEDYLRRKIRERGTAEGAEPLDVAGLVARMVDLRYVDDAAFAQTRASGLLRRGYGARRVDQALRQAGIEEQLRAESSPEEPAARRAALALARKRGFGPFAPMGREPRPADRFGRDKLRDKQIAAMIRAGHGFEAARTLVDAASIEEAEEWAAMEEERHG
ncbi:MAG: regulatory protein RecX [Erythrobacter sp.]